MQITWNHFRSDPNAQHHITEILARMMAVGQFPAPIHLATVYQFHIDIILTSGATDKLYFFDGLPSLTVWPELRFPREKPHEDRRIELSARVIVGGRN